MPSHFSCIGFVVEDPESFATLAERAAELGEERAVDSGAYIVWTPSPGIELWVQSDAKGLIGLHHHYAGASRVSVAITNDVRDKRRMTKLDGRLHAWMAPEDPREPESGMFPFLFDVPDLRSEPLPRLPAAATVQLSVFAHEFAWHRDDEAFAAAQEAPFAPQSAIPTGLFEDPGEPLALFHGHLVAGGIQENATTSRPYWAGTIETLGGRVDVVADVKDVGDPPPPGAVITAGGWLSGRLTYVQSVAPPESGLRRFFKR